VTPLRLAIVGAGHLGRIHARLASKLPEFIVAAIIDPVCEAREKLANETGARGFDNFRDAIGEIDAAVVATPTAAHHAVAGELLRAGIPVLVEKPLAPTLAQANELVQLARKQNLVLQVGHVERFNPALELIARQVRDPRFIQATRTSSYSFRSTDIGVVLDLMIHDLDVALNLAQSPVRQVFAMGISVLGDHEDMAYAQLQFESGCVAQFTASRVSYQIERSLKVFTSRMFAAVDYSTRKATMVKPAAGVLRRQWRGDKLTDEERQSVREHLFEELLERTDEVALPNNAIEEELRDFARSIRTGREPRVSGAAGRDAVAVAELILEKIESHEWDGDATGRHGPFAMPALPMAPFSLPQWEAGGQPQRKAG
jgi:predicted dehydrogenase